MFCKESRAALRLRHALVPGLTVALAALLGACGDNDSDDDRTASLEVLSSRADTVTGGDALLRVKLDPGESIEDWKVTAGERELTSGFVQVSDGTFIGLVDGLPIGPSRLELSPRNGSGPTSELELESHPISGPVFSGPHQKPFVCETAAFTLPVTGGNLGNPLDADCNAPTRVDYVYRSTDGSFKPLANPAALPQDLATTLTLDDRTVSYVVRVETGTVNRAVYQIAVLHDPTKEGSVSLADTPDAWNGKLAYTYGGGYKAAFHQGRNTGGVLNHLFLSRGFAVASASLNVAQNNSNDVISAETTMMVKEKFIETFGTPIYTVGWGTSGGAMQQHHIAQNYPGLLDGLLLGAASPDTVTRAGMVADCSLLENYFTRSPLGWTHEQKTAVSGFADYMACTGGPGFTGSSWIVSGYAPGWIDPDFCDASIPQEQRYDPVRNPTGARCTFQDDMANIFGRDATGRARRPVDSVGVQYGLSALRSGAISIERFVDLNEKVGAWDIDGNPVSERTVADPEALRLAYETGRVNGGGGGLASIPMLDIRSYTDPFDFHDRVRSFATKERMLAANGDVSNRVMWTLPGTSVAPFPPYDAMAIEAMDRWLSAIARDTADGDAKARVVRNKPADLVDACFRPDGTMIAEEQVYGADTECNRLYPPYLDPRMAAGMPVSNDILKCRLKPLDPTEYGVAVPADLLARLNAVFPSGVCDWSAPGVGQVEQAGVWLEFDGSGAYSPMD